MTQGKRKDQIEFSSRTVFASMIGIVLVIIYLMSTESCNKFNNEVSEGISNDPRPANHMSNYLPPSFYSELDSLDKRLDSLMVVEKLVDSIIDARYSEYDRFRDVPAGADSIIKVDGILYKRNEDESQWIPIYLDEDVMWVGNNGDTIWE